MERPQVKYHLVTTLLSFAFLFASVLTSSAQEADSSRNAEPTAPQKCFVCEVEYIEIDRQQLSECGIDLDAEDTEYQTAPFSLKKPEAFHEMVSSLEKSGLAEKVFATSMSIQSGKLAGISTKIDTREFDLQLRPRLIANAYKTDFELRVIDCDPVPPEAIRTSTIAFECGGKFEDTLAINVTKKVAGDSEGKFVVVLFKVNSPAKVASQRQ